MTTLTATERGDLAERMLPVAGRLVGIVHGDGGAADVAHATNLLDRVELLAVIVALAAMADPEQPVSDALAHITWDEHGLPLADPPPAAKRTIRALAPADVVTPSGVRALLESEQRLEARRLVVELGMKYPEVGERVGVTPDTIGRWARAGGWAVNTIPRAAPAA
jgi:hypothetical protein